MKPQEIHDFTDLTCTNLMIKLKILLKRAQPGHEVNFFATREQVDNTCAPFSHHGYRVEWEQAAGNKYKVAIGRQ